MSLNIKELGLKIKEKRKELKLTQEQLAGIVNVTRQAVSNWEVGKASPDILSLVLISRALKLDLRNIDNYVK